jgi:polyisoprenyl-phosphate glycosyltransferase
MSKLPVHKRNPYADRSEGQNRTDPHGAITTTDRCDASRRPKLAILCPVYNEEVAIPLFLDRTLIVLDRLRDRCDPDLYFIDNGSIDSSLALIWDAHAQHKNIYVLVLSRNFGYQCALRVGLQTVEADLYIMIDVDCEDPPEMIEQFVSEYERGFDIVYGERVDRPEGIFLKSARKLFYRLVRSVADDDIVLNMAEFSLITAEVRNAVIDEVTSFPFVRASIARVGFLRKNIPYRRHVRIAGETHYNFIGMAIFAIAGILSASTLALRIPAYTFPFWAVAMIGIAVAAAMSPAPWQVPALISIGFLFIGFTTMAAALYIARTYKNALFRPNGVVRRSLSILPENVLLDRDEQSTR